MLRGNSLYLHQTYSLKKFDKTINHFPQGVLIKCIKVSLWKTGCHLKQTTATSNFWSGSLTFNSVITQNILISEYMS